MSSSLRRGAVAATVTALSTLSLGACGAGFNAQTSGVKPDNASVAVGDMKIQNVNVITDEGGSAAVAAIIFNEGRQDQTLRGITIEDGGAVELSSTNLKVPAGGSLTLGGEGNPYAAVTDTEGIANGNAQSLSFDLSGTGSVELDATVVPATGTYEKWGPTTQPSPTEQPDGADGAADGGQEQPGEGEGAEGGAAGAGEEPAPDEEAPSDEETPAS